jgi:hypothetical protein
VQAVQDNQVQITVMQVLAEWVVKVGLQVKAVGMQAVVVAEITQDIHKAAMEV